MAYLKSNIIQVTNIRDGENGKDGDKGDSSIVRSIYFYDTLNNAQDAVDSNLQYPNVLVPTTLDEITAAATAPNRWSFEEPKAAENRLVFTTKTVTTTTATGESFQCDTAVTLYKVYGPNGESMSDAYVQYLLLSKYGKSDVIGWADGKLYIQATFLNTTELIVKDGADATANILFAAGGNGPYKNKVKIAGFNVDAHCLYAMTEDGTRGTGIQSPDAGDKAIAVAWTNNDDWGTAPFWVNHWGKLHAVGADITGAITATSGQIGGLTLDSTSLYNVIESVLEDGSKQLAHLSSATQTTWPWKFSANHEGKTFVYVGPDGINVIKRDYSDLSNEAQSYIAAGKLFSNNAEITGKITAISGYIGNWTLNTPHLRYGNEVGLYTGSFVYNGSAIDNNTGGAIDAGKQIRIWAGLADNSQTDRFASGNDANFIVTADGTLYAQGAILDGTVYAHEGRIGQISIGDGLLGDNWQLTRSRFTFGNFSFYTSGTTSYLTTVGRMRLMATTKDGTWGGGLIFPETVTATTETSTVDVTVNFAWIDDSGTVDYYVLHSIGIKNRTGSRTQIHPFTLICTTKTFGGNDGSTKTWSVSGVFDAKNYTISYPYTDKVSYDKNDYTIREGNTAQFSLTIDNAKTPIASWSVDMPSYGPFDDPPNTPDPAAQQTRTVRITEGTVSGDVWLKGNFVPLNGSASLGTFSSPWSQIYATSLFAGNNGGSLSGTWTATDEIIVSSARTVKSHIATFSSLHSLLFDNLQPRIFQYKNGSSGRYHYGYIVDELRSAMDAAGLSTTECAAYCLDDPNDPNGTGGIRYSELSVLTTAEVQKLKHRVTELEQAIQQLEAKYESL